MITLRQRQKTIPFDTVLFIKKAQILLDALGYHDFDLGILLTTDATIKKYNALYRNKNKATDILSFSYHDHVQAGKKIVARSPEDKNLGDLIISVPYVYKNKYNLKKSFEQRMDIMLVHGLCHLLGYDHIDDQDHKKMARLEKKLLQLIALV